MFSKRPFFSLTDVKIKNRWLCILQMECCKGTFGTFLVFLYVMNTAVQDV